MEQNKKGSGFQRLQKTLREEVGVPVEEAGAALGEKITAGSRAAIKALTGKEIPAAPTPRNPLEYTELPEDTGASSAYEMDDGALASERAKALREFKLRQMNEDRKVIPQGMTENEARNMRLEEVRLQNRMMEQNRMQEREQERERLRQRQLQNMSSMSEDDVRALAEEFDRAAKQGK